MGSQVIIDLIASMVVFSTMLLVIIRLNFGTRENMQTHQGSLLVQQNIVAIVNLLEYDFRKIGYCRDPMSLPDPTKYIKSIADTSIEFFSDVDNDGDVDLVRYVVSTPSKAYDGTSNPNDLLIYRRINNSVIKPTDKDGVNLGITKFELTYYDSDRQETSLPSAVYSMKILIEVQTPFAESLFVNKVGDKGFVGTKVNNPYQTAYWRQFRLVARNVNNR